MQQLYTREMEVAHSIDALQEQLRHEVERRKKVESQLEAAVLQHELATHTHEQGIKKEIGYKKKLSELQSEIDAQNDKILELQLRIEDDFSIIRDLESKIDKLTHAHVDAEHSAIESQQRGSLQQKQHDELKLRLQARASLAPQQPVACSL